MGRHSMNYQPEPSEVAVSDTSAGELSPEAPDAPAPFPSGVFNSIAPPGGPIDPGVPGAPDSPSYPDGPNYPAEPSTPEGPGYTPGEPDITPSEPDPIPDDAGSPAHYGSWFAADEQAS